MLHQHHYLTHLHLLVLLKDIDCLRSIRNLLRNNLRSIGVYLDTTKETLDLCLNMVYINITDNDDSLIVRTIPFLIIGTEGLGLETVDNAHQTDRHTLTILRTRIHLWQGTGNHTL